ncbi:tRNA epoxyqueuosine(34) reductase QueG [uncultured Clostridium sp.]|uniref:tRNA epoxyqueuosine(34) reductase QueG n=1 Tax=uncultured Clostridium sp. TaxID=59620 RepID=UPI002629D291|nr:tRNA epoxyqueuosine(34) reductase QueG [uncultured Clostridium sp.]
MDRREIEEFCKILNLDVVGFVKMRKFTELKELYLKRKEEKSENEFEEKDIDKRINPFSYMEEGKTIISIAFPYSTFKECEDNGFSVYTKGMDYHKVVLSYLEKICDKLKERGYKTKALVDSNTLPERYIAYLAGIGFIGKNNMLITEKYGSYVFLGEIITDLELDIKEKNKILELKEYKECGKCNICFKECPTKAINKFKRNTNICISYLTQKKDLSDKEMKLLNGRVFGCDSCQKKCIYNEGIEKGKIKEFNPYEFMEKENLEFLINMTNGEFKETFKNTSCGWRGKNTLIRNGIIRKKLYKKEDIKGIKTESPYIKDYINRLL